MLLLNRVPGVFFPVPYQVPNGELAESGVGFSMVSHSILVFTVHMHWHKNHSCTFVLIRNSNHQCKTPTLHNVMLHSQAPKPVFVISLQSTIKACTQCTAPYNFSVEF